MRSTTLSIILCFVIWGALGMFNHKGEAMLFLSASVVYAQGEADSSGDLTMEDAKNYFARTAIFIAVFVALWFLLYQFAYRLLLKYYSPRYCKDLFWSLFLLYGLAWLSISAYIIFEIGFFYQWFYLWGKWIFVFIGALWLIWFMVIMLKKDTA